MNGKTAAQAPVPTAMSPMIPAGLLHPAERAWVIATYIEPKMPALIGKGPAINNDPAGRTGLAPRV